MKNKNCFLIAILVIFFSCESAVAAKIDTLITYSNAMKKEIPALVVTPENYSTAQKYPAVYLLHGYSGSAFDGWLNKNNSIENLADFYNLILIVPDGGFSSWYFDSPVDPTYQYETYIIKELIPEIDEKYATIQHRNGRAITGLSMGGHGALYLSFRHQDLFGAAGSTSGCMTICKFPTRWDIAKRLGSFEKNQKIWEQNAVINLISSLKPNSLSLIIDCGTEDFFAEVNREMHEKLLQNKIPHDYISRPGNHSWEYWNNSIQYQLLFFNDFFKKQNP